MTEKHDTNRNLFDKLIDALSGLPWLRVLGKAYKIARKAIHSRSYSGMYEVLEYESTLELKDRGGKKASFKKRKTVRYLQDNVIAYHDQAWGDGEILLNYRCTPGIPVDRYRLGYKTYILISRRELKNRGDLDEFSVEWDINQGFLRRTEQWETHVQQPMGHLRTRVIFPKSRPPRRTMLIECNRQRSHDLSEHVRRLPDGRWSVAWETSRPRLYENYVLQWEW